MNRQDMNRQGAKFAKDAEMDVMEAVERHKLFGVVRTETAEQAIRCGEAAIQGGLRLIEITLTTPGWQQVLAGLRGHPEVVLGAGTVMHPEQAEAALAAGASFIVSPDAEPAVVTFCKHRKVFVSVGGLTPTEVVRAWRMGVNVVKVFPASSVGGPAHLKALKEPFPHIKLMPTGGVNADNLVAYFKAGATAVGVAGSLFDPDAVARGDYATITRNAKRYVELVASIA